MFTEIVSTRVPEANPQPQTEVMTIEFIDSRLDMKIRATVFDGYVRDGAAFLVIQPLAQQLGNNWIAIDCDDTAFPVDVAEMVGIEQVYP